MTIGTAKYVLYSSNVAYTLILALVVFTLGLFVVLDGANHFESCVNVTAK